MAQQRNFVDRIANRLGFVAEKRHGGDSGARLSAIMRGVDSSGISAATKYPYRHNVTVFRCVNLLSSSVARIPLRLMKGEEQIDSHPIVSLLDSPNSLMDRSKLLRTVVSHKCNYGAAYLVLDDPDSKGVPRGLYCLPPNDVAPVFGAGGLYDLRGWVYGAGDSQTKFSTEEIARFEYAVSPENPLRAVSPIEVARLTVEQDYLAAIYNKAVLENSGAPAGVLKYAGEGRMSEEDARHVKAQWMSAYGGAKNAESIAVLSGNFEFDSIGTPSKDLQWLEGREWSQHEIAAVFQVPPLFVGDTESSGISDAGLRVQERMLYTGAVMPLARAIESVLNKQLVHPIDSTVSLRFDFSDIEALRDDLSSRLTQAKDLASLGVPLNAISKRLELGLEALDWGDQGFIGSGLTTPESVIEGASLPLTLTAAGQGSAHIPTIEIEARPIRDDDGQRGPLLDVAPRLPPESRPPLETSREAAVRTRRARIEYWERKTKPFDRLESKMISKVRSNLIKQRSQVLKALGGGRAVIRAAGDDLLIQKAMDAFDEEALAASMKEVTVQSSSMGISATLTELATLGVVNEKVLKQKKKLIPKLSEDYYDSRIGMQVRIGEGMKRAVNKQIMEGWGKGENLSDIKDRIRKTFNGLASVSRARTIARTEIHIANNTGRVALMKEQGVQEHEWLSSGDSEVRSPIDNGADYDHAIDGTRVFIGSPFPTGGGLRHPGDPGGDAGDVINCRCTVLPVVESITELSNAKDD